MPNRFTSKTNVAQLREALEGLELDPRGKKDTLLRRLNGALRRSESANMPDFKDEGSSGKDAAQTGQRQPLDAFLCFDVEATCVADKQIDWPNEIIEFPVVLLEWVDDDDSEVIEAANPAGSSGSAGETAKLDDPRQTNDGYAADMAQLSGRSVVADTQTAETPDNVPLESLDTRGTSAKHAADIHDSNAFEETSSEAEIETLLEDEVDRKPKWQGRRRLVIKDKFHSYVRPVWQPKLSTFCKGLTGISQETIDNSPTFPEMVQKLEQWLNEHNLLVGGSLRDGACWCTDGPWDLRDFVPKQLHITPLKPDPYPAYFRGPVLNTKAAVNFVLSDLWYVGELEKSAAMEARYRATLEETRRRTEQSRQQAGNSSEVQKGIVSRPPPPESPVQKRLRNRPRLCTTGSWAQSLKGMKMPKFFLTITGQLTALGLGEFQGQQHSGIDDALNIARVVIELARRDVLLDINEKSFQAQKCNWMGKPGQVFWNRKILLE